MSRYVLGLFLLFREASGQVLNLPPSPPGLPPFPPIPPAPPPPPPSPPPITSGPGSIAFPFSLSKYGPFPSPPAFWNGPPPPTQPIQSSCQPILNNSAYGWTAIDPTKVSNFQPGYGQVVDYRKVPTEDLQLLSGSSVAGGSSLLNVYQCNFIPNYIEESFASPYLNLYNWQPGGSYPYLYSNLNDGSWFGSNPAYLATGVSAYKSSQAIGTPWGYQTAGMVLDHCPSAGAVGAASAGTCTALNPSNLQTGIDLTQYGYEPTPGARDQSTTGASMTLNQQGCYYGNGSNNPNCCSVSINAKSGLVSTICAAWSGAHLASQFCVQYGIIGA